MRVLILMPPLHSTSKLARDKKTAWKSEHEVRTNRPIEKDLYRRTHATENGMLPQDSPIITPLRIHVLSHWNNKAESRPIVASSVTQSYPESFRVTQELPRVAQSHPNVNNMSEKKTGD